MLLQIENILTAAECDAMLAAVTGDEHWADGKASAAGAARDVKENRQGAERSHAVKGCLEKAKSALLNNPVFSAAAQPDSFARVMLNRYQAGQSYGDHVDAPYIDGRRTDISFTLFLTKPDDYQGGDLVIDWPGEVNRIKGPQGSAVVYPATSLHRVEEVTSGARISIVGWVKSRVRGNDARETLFELERVLADIRTGGDREIANRLTNIRNNLLRLFGS